MYCVLMREFFCVCRGVGAWRAFHWYIGTIDRVGDVGRVGKDAERYFRGGKSKLSHYC